MFSPYSSDDLMQNMLILLMDLIIQPDLWRIAAMFDRFCFSQFFTWCPWCMALYVSWITMVGACCDVSKKDCTTCSHHRCICGHCGSVKMWNFRWRRRMVNCKPWMYPQPQPVLSRDGNWIRGSPEIEVRAKVLLEAFIVCRPGPVEADHWIHGVLKMGYAYHQVVVTWLYHGHFTNEFQGDGSATVSYEHLETTFVDKKNPPTFGWDGAMTGAYEHLQFWVGSCLTHLFEVL